MGVSDYWIDKLLFLLCIGYWVSYGFIPNIGGAEKNAVNFMYGARGCVDELASDAGIDMRDGHEAHLAGFFTPLFANSKAYEAQNIEFFADECYNNNQFDGTGDCAPEFPYNTTYLRPGNFREYDDEMKKAYQERLLTTFRNNYATTTSTTKAAADATVGEPEKNRGMSTIPSKTLKFVFNLDEKQLFAPNLKDAGSHCDEILDRVRKTENYDIFEEDDLTRVLMCTAMFGWPAGEYCDTWDNHRELFSTPANFPAEVEQADLDAMNAKCQYVSRKQCEAHSVFKNAAAEITDLAADEVALDTHLAKGPDAGNDAALIENPCILVPGYAKGRGGSFNDVEIDVTKPNNYDPHIKGTGTSPLMLEYYLKTRRPDDVHYQMFKEGNDRGRQTNMPFSLKPAGGKYGTRGRTGATINPEQNDEGEAILVPEDAPFAQVETPLGEADLQYLAERLIYDVIILAELAEEIGRGQDFWDKLDARCFSDGISSETHIGIIISGVLIAFVTLGTLQKSFGVTRCFPFATEKDSPMATFWLNVNNYILAIFGGLIGLVASYGWGGFAVESGDHNNDLMQWSTQEMGLDFTLNRADNEDASVTASFLNDLRNGDFHHAINLTSGEAAAIHALTAMCLCILVVASFKTTVKAEENDDGTYRGWSKPGSLLG